MVDTQKAHWRAWRQPIEISSKEPESILVYVYMLVVLGTLIYGLTLSCFFKSLFRTQIIPASSTGQR